MSNVGITLTADDKELLRVLKSLEGRLDGLEGVARSSMAGTATAANQAGAAIKNLEAQTGMSARQMQAALRGVPAQFTDIFTSLASGQQPLTVFLQQGGQLKDMFGGIGPAARALGGYVLGLINPFTLAAAAAAALGYAYFKGSEEAERFNRTLILTGNAGGATADGLMDAAAAVKAMGAGTQGRAAEILDKIAASGQVGTASLARFAAAALQLEKVGGPAAEETAKAFAELGKDPLKASIKLNESTNYLTESVYKQLKALDAQGRQTEAARVAQEAYATAVEQRTPAVLTHLGSIERAWMAIKREAKGAWDFLASIGRDDTQGEELQFLQKQLAINQSKGVGHTAIYGGQSENEVIKQRIALLGMDLLRRQEAAMAEGARTEAVKAGIEADKDAAKKAEEAAAAAKREGEARHRVLAGLIGLNADYAEQMARLNAMRADGTLKEDQYTLAVQRLVAAQPFAEKAARDRAKAEQDLAKALQDAVREREQHLRTVERGLVSGAKELQQLGDELVKIQGGTKALDERIILRLEDQAAALEAQARWSAADEAEAAMLVEQARQLREQIKLRRQISEATAQKAAEDANRKAAEQATKDWQRAADQIGDAVTDALIGSTESFSKTLRRTLTNMFKTMVLRPGVQWAIDGTRSGLGDLFGSAFGGGGGNSALGNLFAGAASSVVGSSAAYGAAIGTTNIGAGSQAAMLAEQTGGFGAAGLSATSSAASGVAGIGSAISAAAPYAALIIAGSKLAMKDQAAGFNQRAAREAGDGFGGKYGVGTVFAETASLFKKLGMNEKWADILSMSTGFSKVFGRGVARGTDQGISGTIGGGAINAQAFQDWRAKGGLFRSDKTGTNYSGLDDRQNAALSGYAKDALDAVTDWAKVLDLPVESLSKVSQTFRLSLGSDDAANQKAVEDMVAKYRDQLADQYESALKPLAKFGESVTDTLQRLVSLQQFSESLNGLGGIFSSLAGLSVDAREGFIAMAGGMETLSQQAQGFVQNYFNRDEIAGIKAREVLGKLTDAGFTSQQLSGLDTRDEFRALVEGLDLSTQTGQQQLAALLAVQGDFAQVSDYLGTTGGTLTTSALLAPTSALLESPIVEPQVTAINGVRDSVDSLAPWLERIVNAVTESRPVTEGRGENESVTYTGGEVYQPTSDGP